MPSLYIHIPFCERKCHYCDFYSVENLSPMETFLRALEREIELVAERRGGETCDTVFFGGGTPSLLEPAQLGRILDHLHACFGITSDAEVTVETNPGTATAEKLAEYRRLGVNRLSVGVQSFRDEDLRFLGRIHDAGQAGQCLRNARKAGFDNLSLDLMYALPGQTAARWLEVLEQALEFAPQHISAYSLIVEDHTPLARMVRARLVTPAPAEVEAELYEATMDFMERRGFEHYEVSNYARPGFRSRHNSCYWSHGKYLGFGPSAHSFWRESGTGSRWSNVANVSAYCNDLLSGRLPLGFEETVSAPALLNERIFLGLRSDGLNLGRVEREFGVNLALRHSDILGQLIRDRLAFLDHDSLRLTSRGFLLCDEVSERLML